MHLTHPFINNLDISEHIKDVTIRPDIFVWSKPFYIHMIDLIDKSCFGITTSSRYEVYEILLEEQQMLYLRIESMCGRWYEFSNIELQ